MSSHDDFFFQHRWQLVKKMSASKHQAPVIVNTGVNTISQAQASNNTHFTCFRPPMIEYANLVGFSLHRWQQKLNR